jgi:hypothetical protein
MATNAPTAELAAAPPTQPKRWWQWALMLPAAAVPLYTAVPEWLDKGLALYNNVHSGSNKEGQEQLRLAYNNMDCLQAPYKYYTNPNQLRIDGTICKSGDVLVRAVDGLRRQAVYFLPVSTIESRIESASPQGPAPTPAAAEWVPAGAPVATLYTAGYPTGVAAPRAPARPPRIYLAQWQVQVLWTRPMPGNPRFIVQHIRRPDGCFDQVIDLANGAVVQVTPSPC